MATDSDDLEPDHERILRILHGYSVTFENRMPVLDTIRTTIRLDQILYIFVLGENLGSRLSAEWLSWMKPLPHRRLYARTQSSGLYLLTLKTIKGIPSHVGFPFRLVSRSLVINLEAITWSDYERPVLRVGFPHMLPKERECLMLRHRRATKTEALLQAFEGLITAAAGEKEEPQAGDDRAQQSRDQTDGRSSDEREPPVASGGATAEPQTGVAKKESLGCGQSARESSEDEDEADAPSANVPPERSHDLGSEMRASAPENDALGDLDEDDDEDTR